MQSTRPGAVHEDVAPLRHPRHQDWGHDVRRLLRERRERTHFSWISEHTWNCLSTVIRDRASGPAVIKERMWNPQERRLFTPHVFGWGWSLNLYEVLRRARLVGRR